MEEDVEMGRTTKGMDTLIDIEVFVIPSLASGAE
jgi:hypothetical protein